MNLVAYNATPSINFKADTLEKKRERGRERDRKSETDRETERERERV